MPRVAHSGTPAVEAVEPAAEAPITVEEFPAAEPEHFLREYADAAAKYYRASDDRIQALVALYSDGRIRIAGVSDDVRLAGLLQNDRGEVLEIGSDRWSRVYVRNAPGGAIQLEIAGGAYDAHVLDCDPLEAAAIRK